MSSIQRVVDTDASDGSAPACSLCGDVADVRADGHAPLGWSADMVETSEGAAPRWICGQCTRRFVRSIEAKLDHQWW